MIDRTTEDSEIWVPPGYIPDGLRGLTGLAERLFPGLVKNGEVRIGPIQKGTPVNLIANIDLGADMPHEQRLAQQKKLVKLFQDAADDLKAGRNIFENPNIAKQMLELSKCPDFVVNKGHYFGTSLWRRTGAERRGQARAHRLRENVLTVNRRDLIKRGLAVAAWLAARQTAAAEASSNAFARLKAAVSGQAAPQPFDPEYIVVGSGAGGGTVAARLAESGFRVLLLEAGGDPRTLQGGDPQSPGRNTLPEDYDVPAFHSLATENEAMRWDFFVRHYKDNDAAAAGSRSSAPRSTTATWMGSCTRAPARSAGAPRTTR